MFEGMTAKLVAVALVLAGTVGVVFLYWVFKKCSRKAMFQGRRFFEFPGIISVLLYTAPLLYVILQEEHLISVQLGKEQFMLLFIGCFGLGLLIDIARWGVLYGLGFFICHLFMAGLICLCVAMIVFVIFLLFAIFAPVGHSSSGYWIGETAMGNEFLVLSIGDGYYQDENLNTYQRTGDDTMLGFDGRIYFIHRLA